MSTSEPTATGQRSGTARWAPSQLWQVPTFVVGLSVFIAVAASAAMRHPTASHSFDATVTALRQGLQKHQDPQALVPLADSALDEVHRFGDRAAEVRFLAGSVYFYLASGSAPEAARAYWSRAVEHFETALQLGPDEDDLPVLEYRLGRALIALDRDVPRALEFMTRSIDRGTELPLEGYRLLVQVNLKLPTPDFAAALAANRKVIELTDDRDADALARARLGHAELLLRVERRGDAVKELERVGARASRPLRVQARLLAIGICEKDFLWSKALAFWHDLLRDAAHVPGGKGRVLYNIGASSMMLETPDYARALTAWQDAVKRGGAEAQAAGLRLGVLRLTGPMPDPTQALEDWRQALAAVRTPADYQNSYLPLEEVRENFNQALAQLQEAQDYERMRTLTELYRKVGPPGYADDKIAQATLAHVKELASNHAAADEVRSGYLRAAEAFERAAQARPGKDGFDALWQSAQCFLQAHDGEHAGKVLVAMEHLDQQDARLAEGWFRLAELERTLNHQTDAHQAYYRSMQYAATPFAARARYQLAMERVARKDWDKAADILQPNLELAVQNREEHEKSFYKMAWILMQKQDYARAAIYLNQAVARYPNNPLAFEARMDLAQCFRSLAEVASQRVTEEMKKYQGQLTGGQEAQREDDLRNYENARKARLGDALAVYQSMADELRERERQRPGGTLTAMEAEYGRRAVLGMAECCQGLGEDAKAVRLYKGLIEHNRAKVESLFACHRIVWITDQAIKFERVSPEERREMLATARAVLLMAAKDLETMDKSGREFRGEGVWTWQRWQQWLAAEQQRLSK